MRQHLPSRFAVNQILLNSIDRSLKLCFTEITISLRGYLFDKGIGGRVDFGLLPRDISFSIIAMVKENPNKGRDGLFVERVSAKEGSRERENRLVRSHTTAFNLSEAFWNRKPVARSIVSKSGHGR